MTAAGKALVIGGSLGGLFAANLLLRAGWDVQVYERVAEELEGRGAGIVTHPELMDALQQAGVAADASLGVRVEERVTLGRAGDRLASLRQPQVFTAWSSLYRALRGAFPQERYHNGKQLLSIAQDGGGVEAFFADGDRVAGDLLVAADGARSTVRQALLPAARPVYAGYVAWRGLVEERALSPAVLADVFPYFAFGLPPREQMIAYPVTLGGDAAAAPERKYNFVWYRPAEESTTLRDLLTDGEGRLWADGIPPPLIRSEILAETRQAARSVLAPQFAEVVEKTGALFFQPIFDLASDRLAFGRAALLGDAAFVARPHCGMGVTKAAGDALALVRALEDEADVAAGLKTYEGPRIAFGRRVVEHARYLGAYMEAQIGGASARPGPESGRAPLTVMQETAMPLAAQDSLATPTGEDRRPLQQRPSAGDAQTP